MIELRNKRIVVIGLARTGAAVAKVCRGLGAEVTVLEKAAEPADAKIAADLEALGVELRFGAGEPESLPGADLIVPSPGVSPSTPMLRRALESDTAIVSEIELAWRLTDRPVTAVTGTNGKTTTTTLIGEMLRVAGVEADVCGNIGFPMIEAIGNRAAGPLIVEVSSFQLSFVDRFRPRIAVLLNLTGDHLDWHGNLDSYIGAKLNLFRRQGADDWAIIRSVDAAGVDAGAGRPLIFGGDHGVFIQDGWLAHDIRGKVVRIAPTASLAIRGGHNLENAMAASAAALALGVGEEPIAEALQAFKGVEHRLEPVTQTGGVLFYNDSKATNPDAAETAIKAFDRQVVLLAGGRNKGNSFESLAKAAAGRVKLAVLFGEAADEIEAAFGRRGVPTARTGSLSEAVRLAVGRAVSGDVVLLAPACASFDMFVDYEERGRSFKATVMAEVGQLGKVQG